MGVAMSGGRDSLLTLLIAYRYAKKVNPEHPESLLQAFYMPSRYSSSQTREAAETICSELGIPLKVISIDDAFARELSAARQMLAEGKAINPLADQNTQSRLRAQRMWNWATSPEGPTLETRNVSRN